MYLICCKTNLQHLWLWHYPERVIIRSEHPPEPHCKPAPFPHACVDHTLNLVTLLEILKLMKKLICLFRLSYFRAWKQHLFLLPLCLIIPINRYAILCHLKYNFLNCTYSLQLLLYFSSTFKSKQTKTNKKFLWVGLYIICLQFVCPHSLLMCYQYLLLLPLFRNLLQYQQCC